MSGVEPPSPRIRPNEKDGRPLIKATSEAKKPKFHVGDKVYLKSTTPREGPYLIATPASATGTYTLSQEDGKKARNGEQVDGDDLESA